MFDFSPLCVFTWPCLRLSCEARGEPAPNVFWTREGPDKILQADRAGRRRAGERMLKRMIVIYPNDCDLSWLRVILMIYPDEYDCDWSIFVSVNRVDGPILELSKVNYSYWCDKNRKGSIPRVRLPWGFLNALEALYPLRFQVFSPIYISWHFKIKVRREQGGSYLCIASNGHPPTVSRRLQLDIKCESIKYS